MTIDLFRNKASGLYFVALEELEDGRLLMITPGGELKPLEPHLFAGPEARAWDDPHLARLLNGLQRRKLAEVQPYFASA